MGLIVNLGEMLIIEMRVYLGCTQVGVTQQLLDRPKIAAGLQKVTCKGMSKHMGMDGRSSTLLDLPTT